MRKIKKRTIVWIVLAILCFVYGQIVVAFGSGSDFYIVWRHGCGFFILLAILSFFGVWERLPKALKIICISLLGICIGFFVFIESLILSGFIKTNEKNIDYIIVLGCTVYKSGPSPELKYRLDEAFEYLTDNPETKCVVSGGQGDNEPYPEAKVMAEYLEKKGISSERILIEDKSSNTKENIRFSRRKINDSDASIGIVTSGYHMYRAKRMAIKQGIRDVQGIPSMSVPYFLPNNMAREFVGVVKYSILGDISIFHNESDEMELEEMRDISTMDLVKEMGLGINLGNTFESCGDWIKQYGDGSVQSYETAWGSPMITQEMIKGYADAGFGVLRIPVAWSNMADDKYNISPEYMAAVEEVVNWALDEDMYVIINIHHDNFWMKEFPNDPESCMARYEKIWTQVADHFKDYDDHLVFESLNEEAGWDTVWNQWTGKTEGKDTVYNLCNSINQKFVDIVRNSGGNNGQRHLLIAGYYTDIDLTCDDMYKMPEDPAGRMAVSVHYYIPSTFAILTEDADWGKTRYSWGTEEDLAEMNRNLEKVSEHFVKNGIPVIVGEYGCPVENKDPESVQLYLTSVCKKAYDLDMCPILWDITGTFYDRENCRLYSQELQDAYNQIQGRE